MGTRCITRVFNDMNQEILCLYRQFDGYPEGHGKELSEYLEGNPITNGIGGSSKLGESFNGMECLAASLVAHFKSEVGNFYIYPPGTKDIGEEYEYCITGKPGECARITIKESN